MNILFIGATHGDEQNGPKILKRLQKRRRDFDWIVGNPKAYAQNTREFEGDLNRSAPGNPEATNYASRRAAEILCLARDYDACIDIHGSTKNVGNFVIITNLTQKNIALACRLPVKNIVYWPAFRPELEGPLSEFFPCGLEIESGPKDDLQVQNELETILNTFLNEQNLPLQAPIATILATRNTYEVTGCLLNDPGVPLQEFTQIRLNNTTFTPLLITSYQKRSGVYCYTMTPTDFLTHQRLR